MSGPENDEIKRGKVICMGNAQRFGILSCEFPKINGEVAPLEKEDVVGEIIGRLKENIKNLRISRKDSAIYCEPKEKPVCYIYGYGLKKQSEKAFFNAIQHSEYVHLFAVRMPRSICSEQSACSKCERCTIRIDDICYQVFKVESKQITPQMKEKTFYVDAVRNVAGQCLRPKELLEIAEGWTASFAEEEQQNGK